MFQQQPGCRLQQQLINFAEKALVDQFEWTVYMMTHYPGLADYFAFSDVYALARTIILRPDDNLNNAHGTLLDLSTKPHATNESGILAVGHDVVCD